MLNFLSTYFLTSMLTTCPKGTDLSVYMSRKLREKKGIPDDLSNIIVSAWVSAEKKVSQWAVNVADINSINLCKEYFATHQIERMPFKQIQALQSQGKNPSFGIQFLYKASGQRTLPANQFSQNPVIFLHMLEHPFDQPVLHETQLTMALCLQTGWSPLECQKIIDIWKGAIKAADSVIPANEFERRHHFLCREIAVAFKTMLPQHHHHPDGTTRPMASRWQTQLHLWCDTTLTQHNGAAANETVDIDEEESRPLKRARYQ